MVVLGIIPPVVLAAIVAVYFKRVRCGVREAVVVGWMIWAAAVAVGTEVLSRFNAISRNGMLGWWIGVLVCAGVVFWRSKKIRPVDRRLAMERLNWVEGALVGCLGIMLGVAGVMAVVSPPNNPDCLSYHMPRQVWWYEHGNVAHYPTTINRQLEMPPLAEFMGLQMLALTWSDRWSCFPAYAGWAVTMAAASLITRQLGASRSAQLFTAALVAVIPAGFLQASTQQNDLVLTSFFLIFVWYTVRIFQRWGGWKDIWLAGLAMALMQLTKGTGLILAIAPLVVLGYAVMRGEAVRRGLARLGGTVVILMVCVGVFNSAHWIRNYRYFGDALMSPGEKPAYAMGIYTPAALVSNVVRNVALHLSWPSSERSEGTENLVFLIHQWIGIDMSDTRTTFMGLLFTVSPTPNEDRSPAPVHIALAGVLPLLVWDRRKALRKCGGYWVVAVMPYVCFLLFCIALKWQPWNIKLHIPMFCLMAPAVATVMEELGAMRVGLGLIVIGMSAIFPAVNGEGWRPLTGPRSVLTLSRSEAMYNAEPAVDFEEGTDKVVEVINRIRPRVIGFQAFGGEMEYPLLWRLLHLEPAPEVFVPSWDWGSATRQSRRAPDVAIGYQRLLDTIDYIPTHLSLHRKYVFGPYSIYLPATPAVGE